MNGAERAPISPGLTLLTAGVVLVSLLVAPLAMYGFLDGAPTPKVIGAAMAMGVLWVRAGDVALARLREVTARLEAGAQQ